MKIDWLTGCKTEAEKEARRKFLTSHKEAWLLLREIVSSEHKSLERRRTEPDYDSPAWACKQADLNGAVRQTKKLLDMLDSVC